MSKYLTKPVITALKETTTWMLWNAGGSLIPIWGGCFLFVLFSKSPRLVDFSNHGEFSLYAAALLASAFFIVFKEYKNSRFPLRRLFGAICVIGLFLVTILFSVVTAVDTGNIDTQTDFDRDFMRNASYILYAVSVVVSFILTYLDKRISDADIREERREDFENLESRFDKLGEN